MINIDPTILIIMGEAILALLVVVTGVIFVMLRARKRDRDAVAELQGRLKKNASKRQEWYENVLANSIEDGDPDANRELAKSWVEKENRFYAQLVDMYMKRNTEALRGLDRLLHDYSSSYLELVSLMRTRIDEEQQSVPDDVREQLERLGQEGERLARIVQTLEGENQRLSTELDGANKEIDQALREYSVAFRPGSGMTGSALPAAPVAAAAAAVAAPLVMAAAGEAAAEIELPEPEVEMAVAPDEFGADGLEELTSEIMAETAAAGDSSGGEAMEEMDLAQFGAIPAGDDGLEGLADDLASDAAADWREGFDERPEEEARAGEEAALSEAAKGPVIDLADEGDIVLPQLNELMAAIELPDPHAADLPEGEELPILDESVDADDGGLGIDEEQLLAQLEGLEEIDLPPLGGALLPDEPPAKGRP